MKVRVKDFQSIEDVKIDVDGFTLLVGESSQGKSATFRALQAAVSNRFRAGQVRNGTSQAEVAIKFDSDDVLKVIKPQDGSCSMNLNGKAFSKLSRTVPKEVDDLCNMSTLSSDRDAYSLNFHPQFEEPMLLGFSQQKVIELLSACEALEDLNDCKGGLLEKRSENKGAFSSLDAVLTRLKEDVSKKESQISILQPKVDNLRDSYNDFKDLCNKEEKLYVLCTYKDSLQQLKAITDKLHDILQHLSDVPSDRLDKLTMLMDYNTSLDRMDKYVGLYGSLKEKLSEIVVVEDSLRELNKKISDIGLYQTWTDMMVEYESKERELNRVVNEGICPVCGKKIGDCTDE